MRSKLINFFRRTFIFLPLIYIGFSFIGQNNNSFLLEVIYGIPFLLFGIYFVIEKNASLILISVLYFSHLVYDYFNGHLTNNIGVPTFYQEICLLYDLMVSLFLLYCFTKKNLNHRHQFFAFLSNDID